jgi:hypothetical protein
MLIIDRAFDVPYSTVVMPKRQLATVGKIARRASGRERTGAALVAFSILALFATLWGLQKLHFDFGMLFNPCGFKQRTGLPCPACGMTTSVLAFARGRVITAFYTQPAAGLLCSLMVLGGFLALLVAASGVYFNVLDRLIHDVKMRYVIVGLVIILAAGWAVTMARALAAQTPS